MPGPPPPFVPLPFVRRSESDMRGRARALLDDLRRRRTVRHFSPELVPRDVLLTCIETAAQAPSGAHKQPWTFALIEDAPTKRAIREAAEQEERAFYRERAPTRWLQDLEPFRTDEHKPYLEIAPALIVVFAQKYGEHEDDKHYYVNESVGIATGFLLAALHHAGLATLTHTPSPMGFLADVLARPKNERAYVLVVVGYPEPGCLVPDLKRKELGELLVEGRKP